MLTRIVIALLGVLLASPPPLAGSTRDAIKSKLSGVSSQASVRLDASLAQGQAVVIENLIGTLTLEGNGADGIVVVEARVVADADTVEAARELAGRVTLRRADAGGVLVVRTGLPVDDTLTYRFPRSEAEGPFAKWVAPLVKRGRVAYPWDGTTVTVGNERGAAALAVHLVVTVPAGASVTLRQVSGAIRTARVRGNLVLDNVDGGITAEQTYGSLEARSSGGEILIRTFRGDTLVARTGGRDLEIVDVRAKAMRVATGNGWVRGRLVEAEDLAVDSTDGSIEFDGVEARTLRIAAANGSVDLTSLFKGASSVDIRSDSGDVTLRVGENPRFEIDAHSGKGSIGVKGLDGLETISSGGTAARYRNRGGGGAMIRLESRTGGVTICRAK